MGTQLATSPAPAAAERKPALPAGRHRSRPAAAAPAPPPHAGPRRHPAFPEGTGDLVGLLGQAARWFDRTMQPGRLVTRAGLPEPPPRPELPPLETAPGREARLRVLEQLDPGAAAQARDYADPKGAARRGRELDDDWFYGDRPRLDSPWRAPAWRWPHPGSAFNAPQPAEGQDVAEALAEPGGRRRSPRVLLGGPRSKALDPESKGLGPDALRRRLLDGFLDPRVLPREGLIRQRPAGMAPEDLPGPRRSGAAPLSAPAPAPSRTSRPGSPSVRVDDPGVSWSGSASWASPSRPGPAAAAAPPALDLGPLLSELRAIRELLVRTMPSDRFAPALSVPMPGSEYRLG